MRLAAAGREGEEKTGYDRSCTFLEGEKGRKMIRE